MKSKQSPLKSAIITSTDNTFTPDRIQNDTLLSNNNDTLEIFPHKQKALQKGELHCEAEKSERTLQPRGQHRLLRNLIGIRRRLRLILRREEKISMKSQTERN